MAWLYVAGPCAIDTAQVRIEPIDNTEDKI